MTSGFTLHVCLPTSNCEQKKLFPSQVAYTDIAITYAELINSVIKVTNIDHQVGIEGGGGVSSKARHSPHMSVGSAALHSYPKAEREEEKPGQCVFLGR